MSVTESDKFKHLFFRGAQHADFAQLGLVEAGEHRYAQDHQR